MTRSRPLPGIAFVTAPAAADDALPRMDIAVFVGFAATGPLHLPVAIESVADFTLVFGGDLRLARDLQRQPFVNACLGPAVRAFFSNGGRRCWVIRVARSAALEALRLARGAVPAVPDGVAQSNRFPLAGLLAAAPDGSGGFTLSPAFARARCEGSWSDALRVQTALTATGIRLGGFDAGLPWTFTTASALALGDLLRFDDGHGLQAFAAVIAATQVHQPPAPPLWAVTLGTPLLFAQPAAQRPQQRGNASFGDNPAVAARLTPAPAGRALLKLVAAVSNLPPDGSWIAFDDATTQRRSWFIVARTVSVQRAASSTQFVASFAGDVWQPLSAAEVPPPAFTSATVVELALSVHAEGGEVSMRHGLGLADDHANAWNAYPDDAAFYANPDNKAAARFALAGDGLATRWLLPLAVGAANGPPMAALPQAATALERDGLSRFGADLFVDPELAPLGTEVLIDRADFTRYASSEPRRLFGLHAALGFGADRIADEATIIALPDAMHAGWQPAAQPHDEPQPSAPFMRPEWLGLPCAPDAKTAPPKHPDHGSFLAADLAVVQTPHFITLPELPSTAGFTLRWTHIDPHPDVYVLEQAALADWSDAREIYRAPASSFDVLGRAPGRYFFRVRAEREGQTSNWSKGQAVQVRGDDWVLAPNETFAADDEPALLELQRTLLRLCAAKGDLFALLAMPVFYREDAAIAFALQLGTPAAGQRTTDTLSYGALYHPWLTETRADGSTLDTPPDGAAAGVLAARALRRGAWVAPANEVLKDVVALTPVIPAVSRQALQDAHVNLLRQEARGFVVMCADTLSADDELQPINVRRLLMLLRKTALRRGANYVFEPNDAALRRSVQRSFERLMNDLFRRGAFAGTRPESSYRVRIGDDLNTPQSVDIGRLIVELKVAPAVPMSFLTVVLQQVGERLTVAETV